MNLPLYIARRYFFSRRNSNFINILSLISMIGVAVGSAALIVALSVFNGMEDLIRKLYSTFDPELKITAIAGKSFIADSSFMQKIKETEGVALVTEVIEDNALLRYRDAQMIIKMKGVSDNYAAQSGIESAIISGKFALQRNKVNLAVLGQGVKNTLGIALNNEIYPMQLWYPNNISQLLSTQPEKAFNKKNVLATGVFALEKQYDESYVFVPLEVARELTDYGERRTSLEIKAKSASEVETVKNRLQNGLGTGYKVQNSDEQHASLLRAIRIEKLFVFLTFTLILFIASFNIFFSLSMIAIEKKRDVAILFSMGASQSLIRGIFIAEGALIALVGAGTGVGIGLLAVGLQDAFGLVSMGSATAIVDAYPVKIIASDVVLSAGVVVLITMAATWRPAWSASQVNIKEQIG